jgi:hypothetical protein
MKRKHPAGELAPPVPENRPRGEFAVAAALALGAAIERTRGHRAWMTAVPVILVNFVAFYGQLSFFQAHRVIRASDVLVVIPVAVAAVIALALESIAVYLAWQAHIARKSHDSALRLRFGAYGVGLGIGVLNYSHFCGPHWKPNAFAVSFAMASAISPALWGVYSNRESRDDLKRQDLIEDHAVRLGVTRWFWYPLRSAKVQRLAAWAGENRPAAAIALYEQRRAERAAGKADSGYAQDSSDTGVTAVPVVTAEKPSSGPASRNRETASGVVPGRAARTTGLVAASDHEQEVILRLVTAGKPFPSIRKLAVSDFGGSIRASDRVLKLASARMNGGGHVDAGRA